MVITQSLLMVLKNEAKYYLYFWKAFAFMPLVVLAIRYNQEADCSQFVRYNGKRRQHLILENKVYFLQ